MNHGRTRKEMKRDSESHYDGMAEQTADPKALERFRRPAYQARRMIRAQGEQIGEKNIRSDADGQKSNLRLRGCESSGKRD